MRKRIPKVATVLVIAFLTCFMFLSLPVLSLTPGVSENMGKDAFDTEQSNRSYKVTLRLNSSHQGKLFIDRAPSSFLAASVLALLTLVIPRVFLRPFFYLFKKRIVLMPIKFTSMFVA
ncbi:hypothetical protein [Paenibacillus vini]|uniref:Uncharacterized protein n=1 Tax=Paenibacillus vini TaxID=1476024 RepID=A0ABQ4MFB0_9BACL|nr:hypothetical protein [Paenibacillus vini]MDN4068070.1 hypothetical protein [Paenibacillus vini]GIP54650.1 hypothetical protein J42TS3_36850 [Paenibacillus vini]